MSEIKQKSSDWLNWRWQVANSICSIDDLPDCFGDKNMINQVFSNLVDNAVKYSDGDYPGKISINGWLEDANCIYCVEDNGIGISPENQSRIFEVFHRLDPHGSVGGEGLGLTIIGRILDRHDGKIRIESQPGAGSKFFVSLPIVC